MDTNRLTLAIRIKKNLDLTESLMTGIKFFTGWRLLNAKKYVKDGTKPQRPKNHWWKNADTEPQQANIA